MELIQKTRLNRPVVTSSEESEPFSAHSFPNPFSTRTFIPVKGGMVNSIKLEIYSADGEKVKVLEVPEFNDGQAGFYWDGTGFPGTGVSNGVYYTKWLQVTRGL